MTNTEHGPAGPQKERAENEFKVLNEKGEPVEKMHLPDDIGDEFYVEVISDSEQKILPYKKLVKIEGVERGWGEEVAPGKVQQIQEQNIKVGRVDRVNRTISFSEKPKGSDINELMVNLESKRGRGLVSDAKYGDPETVQRLKGEYPNLESISVKTSEGPRGPNYISIYFTKDEVGITEVKLVDEQQGNYAGGTIWQEGDSPEKLKRILGNVKF